MANPQHWFSDVKDLAKEAGLFARKRFNEKAKFIEKNPGDWASVADLEVENFIRDGLNKIAPQTRVIGEETAPSKKESPSQADKASDPLSHDDKAISQYTWHVDPIDGSANFVKGIAHFATVISLTHQPPDGPPVTVMGITYDPSRDECFSAYADGPTELNSKPICVSGETAALKSLLCVVTPKPNAPYVGSFGGWLTGQMKAFGGIRRSGAMALDLAWLACGRVEAFAGVNLAQWDVCAGLLQIRNAGGVTEFKAAPWVSPTLSPVPETFCFAANSKSLLLKLKGDIHDL